jgi:hypothetical protein
MHLDYSTVKKSPSLIVLEYSFHQITHLGMTHARF